MMKASIFGILFFLFFNGNTFSQNNLEINNLPSIGASENFLFYSLEDTTQKQKEKKAAEKDTVTKPKLPAHKIATRRSLILPGWGQIYNKKYWKLPLVYGALGVTAGIFIYNIKWYNKTRFAYKVAIDFQPRLQIPPMAIRDSTDYFQVDDELKPLIPFPESLKRYRNEFRQNVDYAALFFLLAWALNVVDAAVDGHMKDFNVNENLTMKIKPGISTMANTTGISIIFTIGKHPMPAYKPISVK